ncbi:MAG: site-2 protease family protein, partial [Paramuribaculum sp.]|nr:site-2 protease family protein [Paramuribaculum sp.]
METFLIKALQLVAALSLLVLVHELGHYFFARIFKIGVERFYLFFNPWFSLLQYDPARGIIRLITTDKEDEKTGKVMERQAATIRVGRDYIAAAITVPTWRKTVSHMVRLNLRRYCKIAGIIDET